MKKTLLLLLIIPFLNINAQDFWTEVSPFNSESLNFSSQISIVDANVVFITGSGVVAQNNVQKISRSLDGGLTWTENIIDLGSSLLYVSSLNAISADVAYLTAYSSDALVKGGIWKTVDGGNSWSKNPIAFNSAESFSNFIHMFDENNGVAAGDINEGYFEIYTTSDAGLNWNRVASTNIPVLLSGENGYTQLFYSTGETIWFGTSKGRIFKSDNRGLDWTASQSPLQDFSSFDERGSFAFKNALEGLLISNENVQYRTIDSGTTWVVESPVDGCAANGNIVFVPQTNNTYFSYGENCNSERGSVYSTDNGMSWINLNSEDANPVQVDQVSFQSGTVGFCIGRNDDTQQPKFFKLTDPLFRLLKTNSFETIKFSASPNPTSGKLHFAGDQISEILIYDVTGKEIAKYNYQAITEADLDMSEYQNGIYLAKVSDYQNNSAVLKIVKK